MLVSLLFVRIWSMSDEDAFWILVAQKLVRTNPELVILDR